MHFLFCMSFSSVGCCCASHVETHLCRFAPPIPVRSLFFCLSLSVWDEAALCYIHRGCVWVFACHCDVPRAVHVVIFLFNSTFFPPSFPFVLLLTAHSVFVPVDCVQQRCAQSCAVLIILNPVPSPLVLLLWFLFLFL